MRWARIKSLSKSEKIHTRENMSPWRGAIRLATACLHSAPWCDFEKLDLRQKQWQVPVLLLLSWQSLTLLCDTWAIGKVTFHLSPLTCIAVALRLHKGRERRWEMGWSRATFSARGLNESVSPPLVSSGVRWSLKTSSLASTFRYIYAVSLTTPWARSGPGRDYKHQAITGFSPLAPPWWPPALTVIWKNCGEKICFSLLSG